MRCTGDDRDFAGNIDFGDMVGCWVILGRQTNLEGRSRGGTRQVVSQQCWSNKTCTGKTGHETTPTFRMSTLLHFFPPSMFNLWLRFLCGLCSTGMYSPFETIRLSVGLRFVVFCARSHF